MEKSQYLQAITFMLYQQSPIVLLYCHSHPSRQKLFVRVLSSEKTWSILAEDISKLTLGQLQCEIHLKTGLSPKFQELTHAETGEPMTRRAYYDKQPLSSTVTLRELRVAQKHTILIKAFGWSTGFLWLEPTSAAFVTQEELMKRELARLLFVKRSTLKFSTARQGRKWFKKHPFPLPPPVVALAHPSIARDPCAPFDCSVLSRAPFLKTKGQALGEMTAAELLRSCSALSLLPLDAGDKARSHNTGIFCQALISALSASAKTAAAVGEPLDLTARCSVCAELRSFSGVTAASKWRCNACRGSDPQGLALLGRLEIALRFAKGTVASRAERTLRYKLVRAIKRGHAEACRVILRTLRAATSAADDEDKGVATVGELELAIKCRRPGVLNSVLAHASISVVGQALRVAEIDSRNPKSFSEAGVFDEIRALLLECRARALRVRALERGGGAACAWLVCAERLRRRMVLGGGGDTAAAAAGEKAWKASSRLIAEFASAHRGDEALLRRRLCEAISLTYTLRISLRRGTTKR